jgi:Mrp family chromosome partitioning ATPase
LTRIFEALENAKKDREKRPLRTVVELPKTREPLKVVRTRPIPTIGPYPLKALDLHIEDTMTALYQNVLAVLPEVPGGRSIQFIATRADEGASLLVREFAKVLALGLDKKILLLDAHYNAPSQFPYFRVKAEHGWDECVLEGLSIEEATHQVAKEPLYISQMTVRGESGRRAMDHASLGQFFKGLKERFDLILIDSPAATESTDGLAMCRRADGVVLVLESEKTRRQVAEDVRKKIEAHGGNILGVLLNKRRFPIPAFIYNLM